VPCFGVTFGPLIDFPNRPLLTILRREAGAPLLSGGR
jgi:hypothetical protein